MSIAQTLLTQIVKGDAIGALVHALPRDALVQQYKLICRSHERNTL